MMGPVAAVHSPRSARRAIRRIAVTWGMLCTADMIEDVALGVYAFEEGGVGALGIAALVRTAPAGAFGAVLVGRFAGRRRLHLMLQANATRALLLGAAALAAAAHASVVVVAGLLGIGALAGTLHWPAQSAALPDLAWETSDLARSNVLLSAIENGASLVGPLVAALAIALSSTSAALAAAAVACGVGTVALLPLLTIPPARPPLPRGERGAALAGFRTTRRTRGAVVLLAVLFVGFVAIGALRVLTVPIAFELVGLSDDGVGALRAAMGFGGVLGAFVAQWALGRDRIARTITLCFAGWAIATVVLAFTSIAAGAAALLLVAGGAVTLVDVAVLTLVQRIVRDRELDAVIGVLEGVWWAALGTGGVVAGGLSAWTSTRWAVAVVAVALAAAAVGSGWALRRVEAALGPPTERLDALRGVQLFRGLSTLALERLALDLEPARYAAGAPIVQRGEVGNRFFIITTGSVAVRTPRLVRHLGRGRSFGGIALLRDVPRTASVRAIDDVTLFTLDRADFLRAITARTRS